MRSGADTSQKGTLTLDSGKSRPVGFLMFVLDDDEVTSGAGVGLWGTPSTRSGDAGALNPALPSALVRSLADRPGHAVGWMLPVAIPVSLERR